MRMASRLRSQALALALALTALWLLGACTGASAPAPSAEVVAPGNAGIAVGEPRPGVADTVSLECRTHADCAIKDIGSCCGYNPRCVNKDSATFPEQVQAQCAKEGRVSTCGFPTIASCECEAGKCAAVSGDNGLVR